MPETEAPVVLHRRRSVLLMAKAAAFAVIAFAPLSLALPIVTGGWHTNHIGLAVAVVAALVLLAAGIFLLRAAKPDWLSLRLDPVGYTLQRGERRYRREWSDVTGVQLTRRKNGRASLPTIMVSFQDSSTMYLDDIYTLPPEDLVRALRQHCDRAENPWPTLPPIRAKGGGMANWKWLLVLPGLLIAMAVIGLAKLFFSHRL